MAPKGDEDDVFGINTWVINPTKDFYNQSKMLVRKCAKPDKNEFSRIAFATGAGFLVMGFIGFFVKLMFIPINNIIVSNL